MTLATEILNPFRLGKRSFTGSHYVFSCANGNLWVHRFEENNQAPVLATRNTVLQDEYGFPLEYTSGDRATALMVDHNETIGNASFLFAALKKQGSLGLYSFRIYPDRIGPGHLVKQYGIPGASGSEYYLGEIQISPNGKELSLALGVPNNAGGMEHQIELYSIDPSSLDGAAYSGHIPLFSEGSINPQTGPLANILSHAYSPGGKYIYYLQEDIIGFLCLRVKALNLMRVERATQAISFIERYPSDSHKGSIRIGPDDRLYLNYQKRNPSSGYTPILLSYGNLETGSPAMILSTSSNTTLHGNRNGYQVSFSQFESSIENSSQKTQMSRVIAEKEFEIVDHLGSVRVVLSDRSSFLPLKRRTKIETWADLFSYGNEVGGRIGIMHFRFGFGGHEKDDEISGPRNHYGFEDYGYAPRTGRRWRSDPYSTLLPHLSPYIYGLNSPIQVIDPDGKFPILINGNTPDGDYQRASPKYWSTNILNTIENRTGYNRGTTFDGTSESKSRFSGDFYFVDGNKGFWPSTRVNAGKAQAKVDAQAVWDKMKETMKDCQITEQLQVVTHSRGSAFGAGYMEGLREEIIKLAKSEGIGFAYDKNSIVQYSVNLAPHQSNYINYEKSGTMNVNVSHIGDLLSGNDATGNVINVHSIPEQESWPLEQHSDASHNTELGFILKILEGGVSIGNLFDAVKKGYHNYDKNRTNGGASTVTKGH